MFSKPKSGYVTFQIWDSSYKLNNSADIANSWLEQAIHGLDTDSPFSLKAYTDNGRLIFTVSYNRVHVFEDEELYDLEATVNSHKSFRYGMRWFCYRLYNDINDNIDDWVNWFGESYAIDLKERKRFMLKRLAQLRRRLERYYDFEDEDDDSEDEDL